MLPVYKAISFIRVVDKGGRTMPWVVLVRTPLGLQPYVVKLFTTELIETRDSVTNEVLGNVLAPQFGLKVPRAALIDFDDRFLDTIKNFEILSILENRDWRLKFATELLDGVNQFNVSAFNSTEAREIIDIDTLFAFDYLIRNRDRTKTPANLLVRTDEAYLIDHELGFEIPDSFQNELNTWQGDRKAFEYHLCYGYLKNSWNSFKQEYFNEFEEHLRILPVNILNTYFEQLTKEGFSQNKHVTIKNYLLKARTNSTNFVNILKGMIS
jgi:hypothetical protein